MSLDGTYLTSVLRRTAALRHKPSFASALASTDSSTDRFENPPYRSALSTAPAADILCRSDLDTRPAKAPRYRRYAVIHLSQLFVELHRAQHPARVRIGRPAAAVSQFIDNRVAQHADLRDLNLDNVARLHEQRRRTLDADTAPRSGNDDLSWQQGNSRPRTEALTHPVRLRAGTTALRRFVQ